MLAHLALDFTRGGVELMAVGNWRVIGHEPARLLAPRVPTWSTARRRPACATGAISASRSRRAYGSRERNRATCIEIVSDDRAFDAVGDVAASLGITFQRLSYRRLVKEEAPEIVPPEPSPPPRSESGGDGRGRRRRWRGGRDRRGPGGRPPSEPRPQPRAESPPAPRPHVPAEPRGARREPATEHREVRRQPVPAAVHVSTRPLGRLPYPPPSFRDASRTGSSSEEAESGQAEPEQTELGQAEPEGFKPHTAPHDEIVSVVQELVEHAAERRVSIDTLANALKARGFRRPSGSPRLMTRLRRIREIVVSPTGMISLASTPPAASAGAASGDAPADTPEDTVDDGADSEDEAPTAEPVTPGPSGQTRRRRRRRRGGRGGRRPPVSAAPTA